MLGENEHNIPQSAHCSYELPGAEFLQAPSPVLAAFRTQLSRPTLILSRKHCCIHVTDEKTEALKD